MPAWKYWPVLYVFFSVEFQYWYLFVFLKKKLFSVKYVAVYKYSSHIKSFSNIELGPQFYVVGESVRLSGPWYWRCNIFLLYIIICELAAVCIQALVSTKDFCTNTLEWVRSLHLKLQLQYFLSSTQKSHLGQGHLQHKMASIIPAVWLGLCPQAEQTAMSMVNMCLDL